MLSRLYRSNVQLVVGRLYLVRLGDDEFGAYAHPSAGVNMFGTPLMVRGSMAELEAFFAGKRLPMPKLLAAT